jgi:hypothetical protein
MRESAATTFVERRLGKSARAHVEEVVAIKTDHFAMPQYFNHYTFKRQRQYWSPCTRRSPLVCCDELCVQLLRQQEPNYSNGAAFAITINLNCP